LYFVLPYASYRILCVLVYLSHALRDEALYVRLLMHWLLSYGKCRHMFAIRKWDPLVSSKCSKVRLRF